MLKVTQNWLCITSVVKLVIMWKIIKMLILAPH